jgi:hypothetical protein
MPEERNCVLRKIARLFVGMTKPNVANVLLLVAQSTPYHHQNHQCAVKLTPPTAETLPVHCYWVNVGTCNAPSPGAEELAIEEAATAFTKHPSMSVLVLLPGSM